jgi:transcriptional regulator with XRE-family HTH domain
MNWSQNELAAKAQVSNSTLRDFESGRRVPIANNLDAIKRALEEAGMQFLFSLGADEPWGVAKRLDSKQVQQPAAKPHRPKALRPSKSGPSK